MNKKIKADDLAKEINGILDDYYGAVESEVDDSIKSVGKLTVQRIKQSKPKGSETYGSWKEYLSGWTDKFTPAKTNKKRSKSIIHNKTHYRLAHLLENGHALWQGGRADAYPHIAPAEKWAEEELVNRLKRGL